MTPDETIAVFKTVSGEVQKHFGGLTVAQLNWKPTPEKWSIAQCLHHLIVSNSTYYPQLQRVIEGKHKNSFYQNIRFVSKFFGNYLIKETGPVVNKPMQNPSAFAPSQSNLPDSIVTDFIKHQQEFSLFIRQLEKADLENTVISSPALSIITYSLTDLLTILAGHEQRHLQQAVRVRNSIP
ncbi:MAG: DinB family protein [Chitinophagales bacterium]|nr:DinB family protein [Chitinophagales bacterium]